MIVRCIKFEVMAGRTISRVDTLLLKRQMERKIGHERAQKYFSLLNRFLSLKIRKLEFNKQCLVVIGRENIGLHNLLIRVIVKNASVGKIPLPMEKKMGSLLEVEVPNGYQKSNLQSFCRDVLSQSPRKGRTRSTPGCRFREHPGFLGLNGKSPIVVCEDSVLKVQEQQSATELLSLGSKPPHEMNSVEDGEEVEQASESPSIYSKGPVRAPLGISISGKQPQKVLRNGSRFSSPMSCCLGDGELPDSDSLRTRLEQKLDLKGLKISKDSVNLLNSSLDVYLKRLIKPCLQIAGSRAWAGNNHSGDLHKPMVLALNGLKPMKYVQKSNRPFLASLLDFRVVVESNPGMVGENWPEQLEKVCLWATE